MAVFIRNQGLGLVVLGIFAILVYVLFKYLWLIGIVFIVLGLLLFIFGMIKK